ncbi:hypothetical protein [Xanthobacter tagetidis]|uniref:Uncharacterized protein n=1 Tax=Xanthobacter tagetidis TaxID=60216 RepID=A0A3L7A7D1_9HYPH|nr:hypothetical protein [Xanthobacter tagetidis]MBB6308766.1 hypothetical protein [Xanthobacter tagetidis]RLP75471.1 hypothetical protein D9R14_17070 [Xanthobacter tagetidis]
MADYFPLLARAIASLPQKSAESRRAVYDRARATLLRQLRSVDPPLPEGEITRERMSLEDAIRRVEAEFPPPPDAGVTEESPPEAPEPAPPPAPPAAPPALRPPAQGEPRRIAPRALPANDADTGEAAADARRSSPVRPRGEEAEADPEAAEAGTDPRPGLRRGEVRSRGAANGAKRKPRKSERGGSWQKLILWTLVACVVLGGVALAVVNRHLILGGDSAGTTPAADAQKSADRVAPTTENARRTPAPRPAGTSGTAQRAVLLEETPGGGQPQSFDGTVTWKTETVSAGPGLPPDIGVRGDVTIPERQISMSFVLRRNTDPTLPASHTVEVGFTLPKDFPFGDVASVPLIAAKPNPQARGTPLAGLSVKVNPTLFLVGLSPGASEKQRNLALLQFSPWIDVPIVFSNSKRALITLEKGEPGDQAFNDAFSAWGELLQRPDPPPQQQQQPAAQ